MLASLMRLVAVRPVLGTMILGFPVLLLIGLGLLSIFLFKLVVFVVLPIALCVWLFRKLSRSRPE
ncbi:MAG TPA: hypothetical protein VGD77_01840 [Gemmatimonadaceae bacterium]|jgi:hypothetical protein